MSDLYKAPLPPDPERDNALIPHSESLPLTEGMESSPKRVFVTGATGFLGDAVCRALMRSGYAVAGLTRTIPHASRAVEGVHYVEGDIASLKTIPLGEVDTADALVHLVGIIAEVPGKGQTFESVHVQGTYNLVRAASHAGVRQIVYVSALGADLKSDSRYARSKAQAEQIVAGATGKKTILRPSIILGPGAAFAHQMEALIRRPPLSPFPLPFIPVPGRGENKFQPVWIHDMAEAIVRVLTLQASATSWEDQAACDTFEITGPDCVTFNELLIRIAAQLAVKKPLLHIPLPLMFAGAALLEGLLPRPPITWDQLLQFKRDNCSSSLAIKEALGIDPMPLESMLRQIFSN